MKAARSYIGAILYQVLLLLCLSGYDAVAQESDMDSLFTLYRKSIDSNERAIISLKLASLYSDVRGDQDSALYYANISFDLSETSVPLKADAAYQIAYSHDLAGDADEAMKYYEVARSLYESLDIKSQVAVSMHAKGIVSYFQADYGRALELYLEALEYERRHDLLEEEANTLFNMAVIYRITGKHEEAKRIYRENIQIRKVLQDSTNLGKLYNNLAVIYNHENAYDSALTYLDSALSIYTSLEDSFYLGTTYITIGNTYANVEGGEEEAMRYLSKGQETMAARNELDHQAKALTSMGDISLERGRWTEASMHYRRGLDLLKGTDFQDHKKYLYEGLAKSYEGEGDLRRALEALRKYVQLNDTLQSGDRLRYLEEMQTKYETATKEQEIIQLNAENEIASLELQSVKNRNTILIGGLFLFGIFSYVLYRLYRKNRKQKELIGSSLREKEALLVDLEKAQDQIIRSEKMASIGQLTAGIAHEINNPLNYVQNNVSALQLDLAEVKEFLEVLLSDHGDDMDKMTRINQLKEKVDLSTIYEEIPALLRGIKDGTDRTSKIVKSLRYLTYFDKDKKEVIDLHESVEAALNIILTSGEEGLVRVRRSYGQISSIRGYPGQISQLLLNILNNAIQAIENEGVITIVTEQLGNEVVLSVSDDGVGMSETVRKRIFEPFFTTKEVGKGTGMGLSISHAIIENHNAKVFVDSAEGRGTTFTIKFPVDAES